MMATAITTDTYQQQIHTARTQLHACFRRAHELLTEREAHLLRELEANQNDYVTETNSQQEELQGMEFSKQCLKNNLRNNDLLNKALADINLKMDQILKLSSGTARTIRFQWNTDMDRDLQLAGEIITNSLPQPTNLAPAIPRYANLEPVIPHSTILDYKNKSIPVITCCKHKPVKSTAPGELYRPYGLAIESESARIYIADYGNHRVQVFTHNGEYCFMFSRNMNGPWGICINNDTVYVSQYLGHCITLYALNGAYVNKVGSKGARNGQFNGPSGIAVNPITQHLFVCDSLNDRVQVMNEKLKYNYIFAANIVNFPWDVKLTQLLVMVLDGGKWCIHLFNISNLSLLSSIIRRGKEISDPFFFTVDRELNILLTDSDKHCVCVFSQSGELITQFGEKGHSVGEFYCPTGIAIDNQKRIIVMSANKNNALQLF